MNAWQVVVQLADEDLIEPHHLDAVEALVRSARLAGIANPHDAVAGALVDRLEDGLLIDAAIASVEELVAIRHNIMLIESGRRALRHDELGTGMVVRGRFAPEPLHAA